MRPPQRRSVDDQALAIAVEQLVGGGAAQSFAHRPDVGPDDAMAERIVKRPDLEPGDRLGAVVGGHGETFVPDVWAPEPVRRPAVEDAVG